MKYAVALLSTAALAAAKLPWAIPSEPRARSRLGNLTVHEPNDDGSYDRDMFPTWQSAGDNCDAREYVLRRDGNNVETGDDCYPTSGTWDSPYDGETYSDPSEVSIDHMVPLKNAWISGASEWTTDRRETFANDVDSCGLWAVGSGVNSSKGDRSPDEWKPPLESIHCKYACAYIQVKSDYNLAVSSAEKSALGDMLDKC